MKKLESDFLIRLVLDVNILFQIFGTTKPNSEANESYLAFRCILNEKNQIKVLCTGQLFKAYEDRFSKIAHGYLIYKSSIYLNLEKNNQLEHVNPMKAPCEINDPDDQIYLDCAYGGEASLIISNDPDFKEFELGECEFNCFTSKEFLFEYCPEYVKD